ncbi:hypothetical protein [Neorhizobium sp. AL 9.2.2]|uniref:hypothetical protein n=1 Tax=Neorhizobium sp. AL 9.2.2 TaxID=2712894 RepID=UPI001572D331|nr:hypothetical protein [Neorhizobium sp. AL 9.2.2]NSY17228.1 hypothetical protein [Neorhizobium sp. AL 9.2.2]
MSTNLLIEIEKFMADAQIGPHRFGILAANNGRLVDRLREGRRVWPDTEQQVRKFMREYRKKRVAQPEQAGAA